MCECRDGVVKMCSPEFDISFPQQNHCRIPSIMLMPSYLPSTLKCKTDGIRPFLALSCQCVQRHLKHTVYIYFLHLNTRNNFLVFFLVITISGIFQTMICHDGWRFSKLFYLLFAVQKEMGSESASSTTLMDMFDSNFDGFLSPAE